MSFPQSLTIIPLLNDRSVITKDTQYTLSEGTKTTKLAHTRVAENPNDALWIGCQSMSKSETLCEV